MPTASRRLIRRTGRFAIATATLFAILAIGMCATARADGPAPPWAIPQSSAERAESEANRLSTMRPPPKLFTCSPEVGAWSRPDLVEFWAIVRSSADIPSLTSRLRNRFGKVSPLVFDGCKDYADGNGPQRHRTIIRDIVVSPSDGSIGLPRVVVLVDVVLPVRESEQRRVPVDLRNTGIGGL